MANVLRSDTGSLRQQTKRVKLEAQKMEAELTWEIIKALKEKVIFIWQ